MPCIIRNRKSGIYYIVSSEKGKRVWRSTHSKDKTEAFRILSGAATRPSSLSSPTPPAVSPENLSQCVNQFLRHVETNFAPKTREIYGLALAKFLKNVGDIPAQSVTSRHVDFYKMERSKTVAATSVNIEVRAIRSFFSTLKRWEIVSKNPCDGIKEIRVPEQPPIYLSTDNLTTLVDSLHERWIREIIIFAAMTGARLGEILNVEWTDLNFTTRMITIRSSNVYQVKAGKMRTVPMNETIHAMLSARKEPSGLVFKGKQGKRANPNFVSEKFRMAIRALGFDRRLHFHSLRHTFASLLVINGVSLFQVQRLLGHSSSKVTEIYSHLQSTDMHHVVRLIELARPESTPQRNHQELRDRFEGSPDSTDSCAEDDGFKSADLRMVVGQP